MARLSPRSFVAVITFMTTAAATVYVLSPVSVFASYTTWLRRDSPPDPSRILGLILMALSLVGAFLLTRYENHRQQQQDNATTFVVPANEDSLLVVDNKNSVSANPQDAAVAQDDPNEHRKLVAAGVSGSIMSIGLGLSQMVAPSKIYGFLDLMGFARGTWDPTLVCVMGGGVLISALSYAFIGYPNLLFLGKKDRANAMSCPLALKENGKFSVPSSTNLDVKLFGGAAIFGIGWAMAGMCPGPALFLVGASIPFVAFLWMPAYILGAYLAQRMSP